MKLPRLLVVLMGIAVLVAFIGCSMGTGEPDIQATVEARGKQTTGAVLGEYTAGWQAARAANPIPAYVPQTWQQIEAAAASSASWIERQEWDLDIGI